jgi:hypothetical protein
VSAKVKVVVSRKDLSLPDLHMLRSAAEQFADSINDGCGACPFHPDKCPTCQQAADIATKLRDMESLVEAGAIGLVLVQKGGVA